MKLAIATCARLPELYITDQPLIPILAEKGIVAQPVVWSDPKADWTRFDAVLIRSTWDYYLESAEFFSWIDHLERLRIPLWNPVPMVRRNLHKFYLRELEQKGIPLIPTLFLSKTETLDETWLARCNSGRLVVKPAISAGSHKTALFERNKQTELRERFKAPLREGDLLVQPFMPEIQEEGEWSFLFFNQRYQFCVNKLPKQGDFRVQRQFGGAYRLVTPSAEHIRSAAQVVEAFGGDPLYARVDGLMHKGQFLLMELELIEPDLYFALHPNALTAFAEAVAERVRI